MTYTDRETLYARAFLSAVRGHGLESLQTQSQGRTVNDRGSEKATVDLELVMANGSERYNDDPRLALWRSRSGNSQGFKTAGSSRMGSRNEMTFASPPAACPMHKGGMTEPVVVERPAQCPLSSDQQRDVLDARNQIPQLANAALQGQITVLPTQRTFSTIPRASMEASSAIADAAVAEKASSGNVWEYPSPQQFYNALVRKGYETPEEHVEMMVLIHNFLNERAWQEVLDWEKIHSWAEGPPELVKFQGRPGELSPRARMYSFLGTLAPSRFGGEPPFDRHDWVIKRSKSGRLVRYVIDYYEAPSEGEEPVFHLDVRPALDSPKSFMDRMRHATAKTWADWRKNEPTS